MNKIYTYFKEINKLNELIRSGWVKRNVPLQRRESVGEHIFTMGLLTLAVIDKFHLELDVEKVLKMVLIHELGEIDVGDITPIDYELLKTKSEKELEGVTRISKVIDEDWIIELWKEFESKSSEEAKFVYKMDKLQAVLQAKYYSELIDSDKLFEEFYNNAIDKCEEYIKIAD